MYISAIFGHIFLKILHDGIEHTFGIGFLIEIVIPDKIAIIIIGAMSESVSFVGGCRHIGFIEFSTFYGHIGEGINCAIGEYRIRNILKSFKHAFLEMEVRTIIMLAIH